ncbi:LysE family translocator [Nonomuraea sp. NBC_01738]|uniref:LysE family translocator n=1 Tax=Nonomuraea sp. NBC_01738 TaxID=2976003 RepID=UPI002E0D2524|nr:LysE family translocator [Nonomuraea sp. NBC_01738]
MIPLSTLAVFTVAALALVLIPGPNHLYITARGLAQGRAAGLASAFGVETGTLLHIAAAAAGLSYLITQSAALFGLVKWAGVAYLVFLGIRALTSKESPETKAPPKQPLSKVFLEGVLVNVLNPKVTLFFLALLPQFVDQHAGSPALQIMVLGGTLLVLGVLSDMIYAFAAGALGTRLAGAARPMRYVSGAVYLGLGVVMAFTGRK